MNYSETYVLEYLSADREWTTADTFDIEEEAVAALMNMNRTYRVRRVMSVVVAQYSWGV